MFLGGYTNQLSAQTGYNKIMRLVMSAEGAAGRGDVETPGKKGRGRKRKGELVGVGEEYVDGD